jgi:putative selenate reductase
MSDIMRPISIDALLDWITSEYKNDKTIFGIRKFYKANPDKTMSLFGEKMETPLGPAAGPHTQLTQNIVASYLTGSRFFELKTCQILDGEDLPVSKPCIAAPDECYNVEWSTELRVPKAFEEYVKGWYILKILSKELGLGSSDGFIFNMSVGYDLEGIKSDKINDYIMGMQDAKDHPIWEECEQAALSYLDRFENIDRDYIENISPAVSKSITLSTLHGCPPAEIERIATYLLEEKGLNTFIKCNPTLLGYEYARETVDKLGFDYLDFDSHHFENDLQFEDALPMFRRLQDLADNKTLNFGVKITNTFPVKIRQEELPGEEMYMSGRALFPLSISVAKKLSDAFDGKLQISYSGGADYFNIEDIFETGIWPITVATTLLKPGGYQRSIQLAEILAAKEYPANVAVDLRKLDGLVSDLSKVELYKKSIKLDKKVKIDNESPLIDCFVAPCKEDEGCPIKQDIPAYLRYVSEAKELEALKVIVNKNPLPFITGTICAHPCMSRCSRRFYESSVDIRKAKLKAAKGAFEELLTEINDCSVGANNCSAKANTCPAGANNCSAEADEKATGTLVKDGQGKVAVVGGGPAGISAGFLLAREGIPVTVFEKEDTIGGVVRNIIPEFRIPHEYIDNDIKMAKAVGVEFKTGAPAPSLKELINEGFEYIIFAIGAWEPGVLRLEEGTSINSLDFLKAYNADTTANPYGENIIIVGGGNTAMDCARAATRLTGVSKVSVVYRRDKRNMPADEEELVEALHDGVEFLELLAPVTLVDRVLTCEKMVLGDRDESGRRSPVPTGEYVEIAADTVIAAVGEKVDTTFYQSLGIKTNNRGYVVSNPDTLETNLEKVYVVGDANRGPATIVEAIADATKAANHIYNMSNHSNEDIKEPHWRKDGQVASECCNHREDINLNPDVNSVLAKRGVMFAKEEQSCDSKRCLECSTICESCVDVCPNRANIAVYVGGTHQVLHVDRMCNECGNCEMFCPYSGAPYKDKFTLFINEEDFNDSINKGFLVTNLENREVQVRLEEGVLKGVLSELEVDADLVELMKEVIESSSYMLKL